MMVPCTKWRIYIIRHGILLLALSSGKFSLITLSKSLIRHRRGRQMWFLHELPAASNLDWTLTHKLCCSSSQSIFTYAYALGQCVCNWVVKRTQEFDRERTGKVFKQKIHVNVPLVYTDQGSDRMQETCRNFAATKNWTCLRSWGHFEISFVVIGQHLLITSLSKRLSWTRPHKKASLGCLFPPNSVTQVLFTGHVTVTYVVTSFQYVIQNRNDLQLESLVHSLQACCTDLHSTPRVSET